MESNLKNEISKKSSISSNSGRRNLRYRRIWWSIIHVFGLKVWLYKQLMDRSFLDEYCQMYPFLYCIIWNPINLCFWRVWLFTSKFSVKIQSDYKWVVKNKWYAIVKIYALKYFGQNLFLIFYSFTFVYLSMGLLIKLIQVDIVKGLNLCLFSLFDNFGYFFLDSFSSINLHEFFFKGFLFSIKSDFSVQVYK